MVGIGGSLPNFGNRYSPPSGPLARGTQMARRALEAGCSLAPDEIIAIESPTSPGPIFSPTRRSANCIRLNAGNPWGDPVEQAVKSLGKLAADAA